jgi:hypothetical protein
MVDVKDVFRKQGRSEEFLECLDHLDRILELVDTLPENEAELMRGFVRNQYKPAQAPSVDASLDAEEIDALLGHDDPDPS